MSTNEKIDNKNWAVFESAVKKEKIGEKTKFSVGNIVSLKSGGPLMTVRNSPASNTVLVDWFTCDEHYSATFYKDQLVFPDSPEEEDNPDSDD